MSEVLPQQIQHDSEEIIYQLTMAGGNLHLAAERLKMTPETVVAVVASDPYASKILVEQSRVATTLHLLDLINQMKLILIDSLKDMDAKDLSKSFGSLLNILLSLTAPVQQQNADDLTKEKLFRALPTHIRRALVDVGVADEDGSFKQDSG